MSGMQILLTSSLYRGVSVLAFFVGRIIVMQIVYPDPLNAVAYENLLTKYCAHTADIPKPSCMTTHATYPYPVVPTYLFYNNLCLRDCHFDSTEARDGSSTTLRLTDLRSGRANQVRMRFSPSRVKKRVCNAVYVHDRNSDSKGE